MGKTKLIMMRHGESEWNKNNRFTGWVDIPLSKKGIAEAIEGGKKIKDYPIDRIFTSRLMRAQMTALLAMTEHHSKKVPVILHKGEGKLDEWSQIYSKEALDSLIPVIQSSDLNERMYGELQGCNKLETADKFGKEQVHIWRRSFDVPPPNGESLAMTAERSIPYFVEEIVPFIRQGQNVFIAAHGNSLRSIVMYLENLTKEEVLHLEIATGEPIIYEYENEQFTKVATK